MKNKIYSLICRYNNWRLRNLPISLFNRPDPKTISNRLLWKIVKYELEYGPAWFMAREKSPNSYTSQDFRAFVYVRENERIAKKLKIIHN